MKFAIKAKSALSCVLDFIGAIDIAIARKSKSQYLILMYHRIIPFKEAVPCLQAGMYVEPETFEMHIRYLKRYFQVVSISEKLSNTRDTGHQDPMPPACILTFDDGWRDFYEYAYPVLKRNQVPATVFLPTGYIGTNNWFWTDRLAWLLANPFFPARRGNAENPLVARIESLPGRYEGRLESSIRMLKERETREVEDVITEISERVDAGATVRARVFLNWEEVREMAGSGLVSFGSHTHSHRILTHLKEEEVLDELRISKNILIREGVVDPSFIPFCYPNGNLNQRVSSMVLETGYRAAVTTGNGWNTGDTSPHELKRVAIHQDMTGSEEMLGCRIADFL